jgi:hypothetical protein
MEGMRFVPGDVRLLRGRERPGVAIPSQAENLEETTSINTKEKPINTTLKVYSIPVCTSTYLKAPTSELTKHLHYLYT